MASSRSKAFILLVLIFVATFLLCHKWDKLPGLGESSWYRTLVMDSNGGGEDLWYYAKKDVVLVDAPEASFDPDDVLVDASLEPDCSRALTNSKDGAFFRESDIAKDHEDWGKKICPTKKLSDHRDFYTYLHTLTLHYDRPVMVGGALLSQPPKLLGEKWVCMSPKYNLTPGDCVALSFGIAHDWSFDDELDTKFGCKVYAFDHTIHVDDPNRSPNIRFFRTGISGNTRLRDVGGGIKLDRYINILKMLKLENATIDYLKLDVEGSEVAFFADVLGSYPNILKNVKMLSMELHVAGRQAPLWQYFQILDCLGFKLWFSEKSPMRKLSRGFNGMRVSRCYEVVWARDRQW